MKPTTWLERFMIVLTLLTLFVDAAVYISNGAPAYVPPPRSDRCHRSVTCNFVQRAMVLRRVV